MIPEQAVEQAESNRDRNRDAVEILIDDIRNDPDSTAREEKLASAIVALRES